jgi:hypothetical protein
MMARTFSAVVSPGRDHPLTDSAGQKIAASLAPVAGADHICTRIKLGDRSSSFCAVLVGQQE